MSTLVARIGGIRRHLGYPSERAVSDGLIIETACEKLQYYVNELNLTSQPWRTQKWTLNLQANKAEYIVTADNWGKAFMVETVETDQPPVPWREIPIRPLTSLSDYNYYHSSASVGGVNPLTAIAFYFDENGPRCKVTPMPQEALPCLVRYEPEGFDLSSVDNEFPFLNSFSQLFDVDSAMSLIGKCGYDNDKMKSILGNDDYGLVRDFAFYKKQFEEYKLDISQEDESDARGFGVSWGL